MHDALAAVCWCYMTLGIDMVVCKALPTEGVIILLLLKQAAAAKAPQLSKEEMKKLRQERDPHFNAGAGIDAQPQTRPSIYAKPCRMPINDVDSVPSIYALAAHSRQGRQTVGACGRKLQCATTASSGG